MARLNVYIEEQRAGDPEIPVYSVLLEGQRSLWRETFGSPELVKAFLRGIEACWRMIGESREDLVMPEFSLGYLEVSSRFVPKSPGSS